MNDTMTIDTARLPMLLTQLRLPTVARLWQAIAETADRESWPAAKTLAALMEHEIAERAQRRTARHLLEARLPAGKTLDRFDFTAITSISKARVTALAEGDSWLAQGTNILMVGPITQGPPSPLSSHLSVLVPQGRPSARLSRPKIFVHALRLDCDHDHRLNRAKLTEQGLADVLLILMR